MRANGDILEAQNVVKKHRQAENSLVRVAADKKKSRPAACSGSGQRIDAAQAGDGLAKGGHRHLATPGGDDIGDRQQSLNGFYEIGADPATSFHADFDVSTRIIIADGLTNEFLSPEVQFRDRKVNIGAHEISRLMGSGPEFGRGPLPTFLSQIRADQVGRMERALLLLRDLDEEASGDGMGSGPRPKIEVGTIWGR